jgi:Tfp pilus assembly protein PilF
LNRASRRLEQAIQAGGRYPDVYYLLGQLYTEQGEIGRARTAYRRAVLLNDRYEAAHEALALLPAEK